jgi:transposase-like protein
VPDAKAKAVMPIVKERAPPESMIYTDDFAIYDGLSGMGYTHNRIQHSQKVYVMGNVRTQTIGGL